MSSFARSKRRPRRRSTRFAGAIGVLVWVLAPLSGVSAESSCAGYDDCLRQARAAEQEGEWALAGELFETATRLDQSRPEAWVGLGRTELARGIVGSLHTSWARALDAGGTVDITTCEPATKHCHPGLLEVTAERLSFTTEKKGERFSAPLVEFSGVKIKHSVVAYSRKPIIRLMLRVGGKKYAINFIPYGEADCGTGPFYLCGEIGQAQQEAMASFVQSRIDVLATTLAAEGSGPFIAPVREGEADARLAFGRPTETGMHTGVDFFARSRSPRVLAVAAGEVARIQRNGEGCTANREDAGCQDHGMGNVVILKHRLAEGPIYSLYAHLDAIEDGLEPGQKVKQGALLGEMGASGFGLRDYWRLESSGAAHCRALAGGEPCVRLHFELKLAPVLENPLGGAACGGAPCRGHSPTDPEELGYRDPRKYGM